jgi:peptide chain release factor subunit 1
VVTVYLDTRWTDEHQRDRARVFLRSEIRRARQDGRAAAADLAWLESQGETLTEPGRPPGAAGAALFACEALGLRELIAARAPLPDAFHLAASPVLRPLATALRDAGETVLVFVDGERARLIPVSPAGPEQEVVLEHEVPGRHRRGGWALLAQSRYQRHIQDHRDRHFEAVVEALRALVEATPDARLALAGEPRTVALFQRALPADLAARVAATLPGSWHEPAAALVARAVDGLEAHRAETQGAEVERVLVEAAKGGRATAGPGATAAAASRDAVHRLYLLDGAATPGVACAACRALAPGTGSACPGCGAPAAAVELGEALVERVLAGGGTVEVLRVHDGLARAGGLAARLRYGV